jgi:beta-xylosidase
MKFFSSIVLFVLVQISVFSQSEKYNAFHPGEIWKDNNRVHINAHGGGMLYHKGVYYWYGEHKIAGKEGNFSMVGVHCYSSKDLYNWTDKGIVLKNDTTPNSVLETGCKIERPKVIYNKRTKKFVMWFHYEEKGVGYATSKSGVAVADKPIGPYIFKKAVRPDAGSWPVNVLPIHKELGFNTVNAVFNGGSCPKNVDSVNFVGRDFKDGQMARDMNLFVDDDGKAYHIYSSESNSTLHISQLTDDYLSHSGKWVRAFPGRFMEGAAMMKRKGKYYLVASGCTSWAPNAARSAVADNIFGPWKELGNPCLDKDSATTYHSQSTYILPVAGKKDAYIFMADRWTPQNPINGRYIWLPVQFNGDRLILNWYDKWSLDLFKKKK